MWDSWFDTVVNILLFTLLMTLVINWLWLIVWILLFSISGAPCWMAFIYGSDPQQYSTLDLHVDTTTITQRSCTLCTVHKWLAQLHSQTGWGLWPWARQQPVYSVLIRTLTPHKTCSETCRLLFFLFFTRTGTAFRHHFTPGIVLGFPPLFQQNSI